MRHRKPENFLSGIARNGHGIVEEAELLPTEAADEALVMGLRLREGIDVQALAQRFSVPVLVDWERVSALVRSGHLEQDGTHIALTGDGRLLLDHILGEIAATDVKALAVA
jgi:oxygen-independent coproporphyrinogen-3 oxidase